MRVVECWPLFQAELPQLLPLFHLKKTIQGVLAAEEVVVIHASANCFVREWTVDRIHLTVLALLTGVVTCSE